MIRILLFQAFQTILLHQILQLLHRQKREQNLALYIPKVSDNELQLDNLYHPFLIC